MEKEHKNKLPWIFWLNISVRKQWFSYWWKTRGANYLEFQVWIFRITIGMPWVICVIKGMIKDNNNLDSAIKTNEMNLKSPFSFKVSF